ncbi:MAG: peroxidase, partial [Methylococcales bacterium]
MNNSKSSAVEFDDLQGLLCFGYGKLTDSRFLLLNIVDAAAARSWLQTAPIATAQPAETAPATALQIAFSMPGLTAIGLSSAALAGFPDEFVNGMSGDEGRSRRLGDVDDNAPAKWQWGGEPKKIPHVLMLLYALPGHLEPWQASVQDRNFAKAFKIVSLLSDNHSQATEPFGFADGISQPDIDWRQAQATNQKDRQHYSNRVALGEMVLGYRNEYGYYTARPLIDPGTDANAEILADALDKPGLKDFTRNGTYLVLRHLSQDVPKFWQFLDQTAAGDAGKREQLAVAMVGRSR